MRGIDISSNQGKVNFDCVKGAGVEVVYIKATEGLTYVNPYLLSSYKEAKANGLKVGFYHFLRANDPVAEAKHFLQTINGLESDCKYCIDCETTENQTIGQISDRVKKFADYLISQGKEPCLYTYESFYNSSLNSLVKDLPLWIAHYGVQYPYVNNWVGFQYSEKGSCPGVTGYVDLDTFTKGIFLSEQKGKWIKGSDGYWHFIEDGAEVKNAWRQDSKDWCYLDKSGHALVNGWAKDSTGWCFCGEDCRIVRNTMVPCQGKEYYINKDGYWYDKETGKLLQ